MHKRVSGVTCFRLWHAAVCATFLLSVVAGAQAEQHPILTTHVPEAVSSGAALLVGHVPGKQLLSLVISLPLRNEAELDALLREIYDPENPKFHKYLSVEEFRTRFGPTYRDYLAVLRFAQANGLAVIDMPSNQLVLDVEGSAQNIERAFHVKLGMYQHPTENRTFYSPDREPSVDLDAALLHVTGLDNYTLPHAKYVRSAQPRSASKLSGTGSGPGGMFVGSDLRSAYYGSGALDGAGQSVGLFEYAGYEVSDVQTYFNSLDQPLNVPINGVSLNGQSLNCVYPGCDDSEQAIDIEMAISMAPSLSQVVVYVGKWDISIFSQMASDNTSKQLSCSWGWTDDGTSLDPILKEIAVQGQSVFVATGDDGSYSAGDYVWPADDAWVTAVGGTDLVTRGPGGPWESETGWSGSAGMPSKNGVPIPVWQKNAAVLDGMNHASKVLRNIPDVSAEANTNQYSCADATCFGGSGGTSYAAPEWAGIIAMANQQAVANGQSTLGFLNPALYGIGEGAHYDNAFHDETSGSNGAFSAVVGYDLVTGWGSPSAAELIEALTGSN
ncbi:MAG: protease pro-enzyme activation domain-containing protein [Candidatus Sulfotelmatobacter sp.]